MNDFNSMWGALQGAVNQTGRVMPSLGVLGILGKPIAEAGLAGLGWGAGATKAAASGHMVDPGPSLYHALNIYGLGGPAGGLTSGGAKAAPWFSAVSRAVEAAPLKQAPGQQWAGTIKNTPGVKQEELDWLGVPEWLASQPGPVTKQQLSDYIAQNKVEVQEVAKGEDTLPAGYSVKRRPGGDYAVISDGGTAIVSGASRDEALRRGLDMLGTDQPTKFSQWQMPGGENYRELLLTLPRTESPKLSALRDELEELVSQPASVKTWKGEDRTAAFDRLQKEFAAQGGTPKRPVGFTSGHYDEPNVLAHVRFNDRVDAQGKKTLFIEEIQSDWHQKGRKQGYLGQKPELDPVTAGRQWAEAGGAVWDDLTPAQREANIQLARDNAEVRSGGGVPDAPFKSSWPELSLKRMVKWAADNGYDSVSWTPGKVQAARYDLSKQIKKIRYEKGRSRLLAYDHHDRIVIDKPGISDQELADYIGKEPAEKLLAMEPPKWTIEKRGHAWHVMDAKGNTIDRYATRQEAANAARSASHYDTRELSGLDLQVGGEGMKGFYDKILVSAANKLGKKYGARVGVAKIGAKEKFKAGQVPFDTLEEATAFANQHARDTGRIISVEKQTGLGQQEVWSLPITDAMRKEIGEKGLPLFTGGQGGSLAAILNQALTGDSDESLGAILSKSLKK